MPNPVLGIDAELNLSDWTSGVNTLLRDDPKIASAMKRIADAANEARDSLNDVDGDISASIDLEVDTGDLPELETALEGVEGEHEAVVTTDADQQPVIDFTGALETVIATAARAVLAVAALGGAAVTGALTVGIKALNDYDGALDSIVIHTGRAIPGARELIEDIYNDGFDASKQQIADVIALTAQLGIASAHTGDATREAFITAANTGQDVSDTLRTMNRLVESGLAANFADAGDLLTVGLQNGANLGGDMNTTLQNSASVLHDMGFTGEEALALISNGLQAGYNSAGDVVNQLLIVRQRLSENNAEVAQALRVLGQTDEADAYLQGTISGGEFMAGLSDAFADVSDPAARLDLQNSIFGGRQGRNLSQDMLDSLGEVGTAFDDIKGRSHAAYEIIKHDFDTEIRGTFNRLEGVIVRFLSGDQIDLPGKLDTLEEQFGEFTDQLEQGKSVGEALEIAIDVPGLADQITRIESVFGNFLLMLGDMVADFARFTGNTALADSIHRALAPLAADQLTFDLQLIDSGGERMDLISAAQGRGVSPEAIRESLQTALDAALQDMDFELADSLTTGFFRGSDVMQAQVSAAVDAAHTQWNDAIAAKDWTTAATLAAALGDPFLQDLTSTMEQAEAATANGMARIRDTIGGGPIGSTGERKAGPQGAPSEMGAHGGSGAGLVAMGGTIFDMVGSAVQGMTQTIAGQTPIIDQNLQLVEVGMFDIKTSADTNLPTVGERIVGLSALIIENFTPVLTLFQQTAEAMAFVTGGGGGGSLAAANPASHDSGGWLSKGQYTEIGGEGFVSPGDAYALGLPSASMMSRYDLVSGAMNGGTSNTNNKNISINNNFNVASQAEAAMTGDRVAAQLRGY